MHVTPQINTLYYGDCLEVMRGWGDGWVDEVYLDPPFNSNADYNIIYGTNSAGTRTAQVQAFTDTWTWDEAAIARVNAIELDVTHPAHRAVIVLKTALGETGMLAYTSYMAERLAEMHRLLKPTGTLWLHCDQTASHYLKIALDLLFGARHFCNEIMWKKSGSPKPQATFFGAQKDVILVYAKDASQAKFHKIYRAHDEKALKLYRYDDNDGRGPYYTVSIEAYGLQRAAGRKQYEFKGRVAPYLYSLERLQAWDAEGRIHTSRNGLHRRKQYLSESPGIVVSDIWTDSDVNPIQGKERLYPTQKPLALLERIVKAGTDEGDIVLDPFCGCGTTIVAAHKLNRQWIGIDISPFVVDIIETQRFGGMKLNTDGIPTDMESAKKLAREKPFHFEAWAVTRIPGLAANDVKHGDRGIDGRGMLVTKPAGAASNVVLAQVKGGRFQMSHLRDFLWVLEREKALFGVFITLEPITSSQAKSELARLGEITVGASVYPRVQPWSVQDYFDGRLPQLPPMNDPYTGKPLRTVLPLGL